jgi:hypothetical protein
MHRLHSNEVYFLKARRWVRNHMNMQPSYMLITTVARMGSEAHKVPTLRCTISDELRWNKYTLNSHFPRRTPVQELHKAFNIPYIYDYITKLCRQQARVIENHKNANVRHIWQGEARHRKHKRLKLDGGQSYDRSSD